MKIGSQSKQSSRSYLDGQCLIAMPGMADTRFSRSVVYVCAHSEDGAMGIIVNKPAADTKFPDLLVQLDVIPSEEIIRLPSRAEKMQVLRGGPVETKRGFVLLPRRWVVERSFGWATRFRRLVRDYERLPETVRGLHFVAFACLMLKQAALALGP